MAELRHSIFDLVLYKGFTNKKVQVVGQQNLPI